MKKEPTAAELMAELAGNADYQAAMSLQEQEDREREGVDAASSHVMDALVAAGLPVQKWRDIEELDYKSYRRALPIIATHIAAATTGWEKEALASLFASTRARGWGGFLIEEFNRLPSASNAKWAIGNALAYCATREEFDSIVEIVRDKSHGKDRGMFVLALARVPGPASVQILIELLNDEQVLDSALMALGRLRATDAVDAIKPFAEHENRVVRGEANKALSRMAKRRAD